MGSASSSASRPRPSWARPAASISSGWRMKRRCSCRSTTSTASACGARSPTTKCERLFNLLGDGKIDSHQNWKGRFKDNSDRMRTGSIYDVVEVLKSLTFLEQVQEPVVPREADARSRQVPRRLGDHRGDGREDARRSRCKVEKALERCFATKARNAARGQGGSAAPVRAEGRPWPRVVRRAAGAGRRAAPRRAS